MITYKINNKPTPATHDQGFTKQQVAAGDFNQLFHQQIQKNKQLKFSKHATERLSERNINLTNEEMQRLDHAIHTAEKKGIKETLIIMDNRAFIASVKNKTVITAAVEEQLKENVFTNIDGAVIV